MRALLCFLLALCFSYRAQSQTFLKDIKDVYDTVWPNNALTVTYAHGHGSLISSSVAGAAGGSIGWYRYNHMIHLNDNGDSVWVKRNALDTTFIISTWYGPDTINYTGLIQSVTRLNNGNYVVAGNNFDTSIPVFEGYMIKQFDSMGNFLSGYVLYDSMTEYQRYIKVLAADGNNFYILYDADSIFYASSVMDDSIVNVTRVQKMDDHYNVLWSNVSRYACLLTRDPLYGDVDINSAFTTVDTDLVFVKLYDTSLMLGTNKQYIRRLHPDGTLNWEIPLQNVVRPDLLTWMTSSLATRDSGIVLSVTSFDSTSYSIAHLLKFNAAGAVIDSVVDSASINGVELSNGNLLFTSALGIHEFNVYDGALNYLYSMPVPFTENDFYNPQLFANPVGGAFLAFSGIYYTSISDWHIVAINFDSLFRCYPSLVDGTIYQDNNTDCTYNTGDFPLHGASATLHDATTGDDYYGFCNAYGNYSCNVPNGNYTVSHTAHGYEANECGAYTHLITSPVILTGNSFADTLVPGVRDLILWMIGSCFVPGDTATLQVTAFNHGSETVDTTVTVLLDPNTSFISSVPSPVSISGDTLVYHVHLLSDSVQFIDMTLLVSTAATLGDTVMFTATSPYPDNVSVTDDSAVYRRGIASSFDPNFKSANQPLYFHRNNTMVYTIGFENTGNYMARDIVIIDTLDAGLDPSSFELLSGNPMRPIVNWMPGNRLYMRFPGINLPDSVSDPVHSHGQVSYAIKVKSTTPDGYTVHNRANIYFDYNKAIVTDQTTNILIAPAVYVPPVISQVSNVGRSSDVRLFPNPSTGTVNISIPASKDVWEVSVADVSGRVVQQGSFHAPSTTLTLDSGPGIYMVTMTDQKTGLRIMQKLVITTE